VDVEDKDVRPFFATIANGEDMRKPGGASFPLISEKGKRRLYKTQSLEGL